jgi:asparagine synthase (glutamine-hydrolysing)
MCGIAGFFGDFDAALLERMAASIAHRGPDDAGFEWLREERVGLAHRRLSIIDLSPAGHQPMWDASGSVVITYNGEIYNYRELRKELEADGHAFRGHSDTEVLLALYLRDGEALLSSLNGIFAFAIWDGRTKSLFLARDHLGVKPLYHTRTARGFLFASELKALLQCPEVDRSLHPEAVDYTLHFGWSPSPHTLLRSVEKLEPGCAMVLRDRGRSARRWRFYELPYDRTIEPLSAEAAAERVREQIGASVRRQMVADVPVGAFLSGGLDSSSVVAFARESAGEVPLRCFTIGFHGEEARAEGMAADQPHAERVARHLGVQLETIWVGPEMVDEVPGMLFHLDEPTPDPAPVNALLICRLARQHGMKVLLSGAGGDDVFTGYRRHVARMHERWWAWLPHPARRALARTAARVPIASQLARRAVKAFQYADLDGDERLVSYFYWVPPGLLSDVYAPALRSQLAPGSASRPMREALARLPAGVADLNRMLFLEGKFFLVDHNLNYTDKVSMASGVEVRVPLLDPDLVALAARLPVALKQRGNTGKWILRKAMEPLLLHETLWRGKAGFGAPLRHWVRGPLRPLIEDALSEHSLARRGLFDPAGVRRLLEADRARRIDGAYAVFSLVAIELWCRMFIDPPAPTRSGAG